MLGGGGAVNNIKRLQGIRIIHFLKKFSMYHIHQNSLEMHMGENSERGTHLTQQQTQSRTHVWGEGTSRAESDRNYQISKRASSQTASVILWLRGRGD